MGQRGFEKRLPFLPCVGAQGELLVYRGRCAEELFHVGGAADAFCQFLVIVKQMNMIKPNLFHAHHGIAVVSKHLTIAAIQRIMECL